MPNHVAVVTYETPATPWGGIAAVIRHLPTPLARAAGRPVTLLAPYHHRLAGLHSISLDHWGHVDVPFDGWGIRVYLFGRVVGDSVREVYLRPDQSWIFAGLRHPYDLAPWDLARDAVFFGSAAARALDALAPGAHHGVFLHDWEAATTALAMGGTGHHLWMTLHNTYDAWPSDGDLARVRIDGSRVPGVSVLARAHGVVRRPVLAVSRQFAAELSEDPLQVDVLAPHLRWLFAGSRAAGIDNGPFLGDATALEVEEVVEAHGPKGLQAWKAEKRRQAWAALERHVSTPAEPCWGDRSRFRRAPAPWFVIGGRDDPIQKGFDVAAAGVRRFLGDGGDARFLFFPLPGEEGLDGLRFLADLAWDFPGEVLVLPFRWTAGYLSAISGASFGVMPSLYEPFGSANEFTLLGTVPVARATGGLVQQVVPLRGIPSYNHPVHWRASSWHPPNAAPTGLLYREYDGIPSGTDDWRAICAKGYSVGSDRVYSRSRLDTWRGMTRALAQAIDDAARLDRDRPEAYAAMVVGGIRHVRSTFSWERAASEYASLLVG